MELDLARLSWADAYWSAVSSAMSGFCRRQTDLRRHNANLTDTRLAQYRPIQSPLRKIHCNTVR